MKCSVFMNGLRVLLVAIRVHSKLGTPAYAHLIAGQTIKLAIALWHTTRELGSVDSVT